MYPKTVWRRLRAAGVAAALISPTLLTAPAVAGPERQCDCKDNDRDGAIDERADCLYDFEVEATADDTYDLAMDGVIFGQDNDWQLAHVWPYPVQAGRHVLSMVAEDEHLIAQGFLAEARSPFMSTEVTGGSFWHLQSTLPLDPNWRITGNGVFTADGGHICPGQAATWSGIPASLAGSDWVWAGGCDPDTDPTVNYGVAEFEICPEASVCCALEDGTVTTLLARECDDIGGTQTWADLCEEVCCQLRDGTVLTTTVAHCDARGGAIVPDDVCLGEECNCEDDDGDGLIDEGIDCAYAGDITLTADDAYDMWIDGAPGPSNATWSQATTVPFAVGPGTHSIAVEAWDVQLSWQGFLARVQPPFAASYDTGAGLWQLSSTVPAGAAWRTTGAGLPVNDSAAICANQAAWGGQPAALAGADWVWDGGCDPDPDPRQNAAYTEFEVCMEAWVCCVLDDGTVATTNAIECEFNGQIVSWAECAPDPCEPIECPPDMTPVDTDGDGCDDACKSTGGGKGDPTLTR